MKRNYTKILGITLIVCTVAICICSAIGLYATYGSTNDNDIASFLQFEQELIALNNDNVAAPKDIEAEDMLSSQGNKFAVENNINEFYLQRLIVQGNLEDTYGASNVIGYGNLHILSYSSPEEAQFAYINLSSDSSLSVSIDGYATVEGYADESYNYSSYANWGAEAIDIGGYRQFLVDNNVEKEVVVVVLDTGINTSHPMFKGRLLTDENGKIKGYSYYNSSYQYSYDNLAFDIDDPSTSHINEEDDNKYSFEDDNGHGSHVAGIIASLTPSNVKILPIKMGNQFGRSTNSIMMLAYLRVLEIYSKQHNVVCTNLSFSGAGKDSEDQKNIYNEQIYEPLIEKNILPITGAGNDSAENNVEGLKAVVASALKKQDNEYLFDNDYSNFGKIVDISAPGTSIMSAWISDTDSASSACLPELGTSVASPQVAGAVALLYLNPNLPDNFTAKDIEQMLYDCAIDLGKPGYDELYGNGMVNIRYFQVENTGETLSFYKNDELVTGFVEHELFDGQFSLSIQCSNPEFEIIYTTDKSIPALSNSITYTVPLTIDKSTHIYAMGIKVINGEIVDRTDLVQISYFCESTPLEDCFALNVLCDIIEYTGHFTHLTIPDTINGKKVLGIGKSAFKDSDIQSITLPETVTEIGGYAFQNCDNLEYIYAPNVTKLYVGAFEDCDSLTAVYDHHPSTEETLGAYFPALTETIGFSFGECTNLKSVKLSNLVNVGSSKGYDFQACTSLESVELPSIKSIPVGTFISCESLSGTFYIGKDVSSIKPFAFSGCKITSFVVDSRNPYLYTDGLGVYSQDTILAFATGNENIDYAISNQATINGETSTITNIANCVMYDTIINELTIPASITHIGENAFLDSKINTLYYNATNCDSSGYYHNGGVWQPFSNINTIEIGANVECVPRRLFQEAELCNLVINSYSTVFAQACFAKYDVKNLDKLILNFPEEIGLDYLDSLFDDALLCTFGKPINSIYTKTAIPADYFSQCYYLKFLKYAWQENGYYVYSQEDLYDINLANSLKFDKKSISLGNKFEINFYVNSNILEGCTGTYVRFEKPIYNEVGEIIASEVENVYDCSERTIGGVTYYVFTYDNINSFELGNTIYAEINTTKIGFEDIVYTSAKDEYSVKMYAERMIEKSSDAELITLLVDMLNYGAAAQMYFNYNEPDLANAGLTEEQKAFATKEMADVKSYKQVDVNNNAKVSIKGCTLNLINNVENIFYVNLKEYNAEDVRAVITYIDYNGKTRQTTINGTDFVESNGAYKITFADLAVSDMRSVFTMVIYDIHTNKIISDSYTYSIESYIASTMSKMTDPEFLSLLEAMIKYGDSSEKYFT